MVGVGMIVAATGVVGGYAVLLLQSRGRARAPLPLSAFSLALLFLIAPVPLVAVQSIRHFQGIASAGHSDPIDLSRLTLRILRPLWLGCLGFVSALGAAVLIDLFRERPVELPEESSPRPGGAGPVWTVWILGAALLLVLPAAVLVNLMRGLASLVAEASIVLTPANPDALVGGMTPIQLSDFIARRLLLGTLGGAGMTLVVAGAAIASIAAHRYSATSAALDRLSQGVTWVAGAFGIWTLVLLTVGLRSAAQIAG